jgi:hypothetical protein
MRQRRRRRTVSFKTIPFWASFFFNEQCMKRCCLISKKMTPKCVNFQISLQFFICSIKSSIAILILRRSSIAFLPKSDVSPKVGRLFHFGIWSWIYAIWPSIDQQTFNFFNLTPDSDNSSPSIYAFFFQFSPWFRNWQSNFNIYIIKPLIWPNQLLKIINWLLNFNLFQLKPKLT